MESGDLEPPAGMIFAPGCGMALRLPKLLVSSAGYSLPKDGASEKDGAGLDRLMSG
jgi:hypothetical protein